MSLMNSFGLGKFSGTMILAISLHADLTNDSLLYSQRYGKLEHFYF